MGSNKIGRIWLESEQISWSLPDFLLKPRGDYFHEPDDVIERLNKLRSLSGGIIVIAMIVFYQGLARTGYRHGGGGLGTFAATGTTPQGAWLAALASSFGLSLLFVPVVALALVLCAERRYRLATLYQMRWVVITAAAFAALCGGMVAIVDGMQYLEKSLRHSYPALAIALILLDSVLALFFLVMALRAFYLMSTGFSRADDAHPLLAPIVSALVAWTTCWTLYSVGASGGLSSVPGAIGRVTAFGGACSVSAISVVTLNRLRKDPDWPFRCGPSRFPPAASTSAEGHGEISPGSGLGVGRDPSHRGARVGGGVVPGG